MDAQSAAMLPFNFKILQTDDNGIPQLAVPFLAMLNPENVTITETVTLNSTPAAGVAGTNPNYINTNPRTFNVELNLDGTGVNTNGVKIPVTAQVLLFRACTTTLDTSTHRTPYLLVQYGLFICNCTIKSSTVTYTMFDMTGLPIRAKISAQFEEVTLNAFGSIMSLLSSPDMTHLVTVKDGDLLPLLTYQTYNNQDYYIQVAKVNKLKNFRKLVPGTTLAFPPIATK